MRWIYRDILRTALCSAGALLATLPWAASAEPVRYSRDIAPILANHCFTCHGPDEAGRKAGLRLDRLDGATAILESGKAAVVPGDPDASELIARVITDDHADLMPPPGKTAPLAPRQIALLQQWIAEGANYDAHWSFVPPVKAPLPTPTAHAGRTRNAIDHFIFSRLEQEGLEANPPAEPEVLLRRVSLDLTGLPPTLEALDAFKADPSPEAYERAVDDLLASPRFGEQWTQVWLDLARYADTKGYEKDDRRTMWPFRDWVIKAINANMPFDQFTREQLAGDLLPEPTTDQIIATAFHRNTMTNDEGGTDNEEFRTAAVFDRVDTTMQVWMGMTMVCAQCHTHKYDPIAMREYYSVFAFFNQTEDADLYPEEKPLLELPSDEQRAELSENSARLNAAEAALKELVGEPAPPPAAPQLGPWYALGPFNANSFEAVFDTNFGPESSVDLAAAHDGKRWRQEPTLQDGAALPLEGRNAAFYFYRVIEAAQPMAVELGFGSDDGIKAWVNNQPVLANPAKRGVAPDQEVVRVGLHAGVNTLLVKIVNGEAGGAVYFKLRDTPIPAALVPALLQPESLRDESARQLLARYDELQRDITRARNRLDLVAKEVAKLPVMRELPEEQRRQTHLFERGSFLSPKDPVEPGVPEIFHPFPAEAPKNRLGLAQWLVSRDNPLTARVTVNRFWERFFGQGIVRTTEDFGTQGEWPTHPELLDWLAVEFMESGWDIKALCKLIVLSETYRQSSHATNEKRERDPLNELYARGPRFRLPAEAIRDQALRVSGLLSEKMYGPSVMPPQPEGLWQIEYSNDKWVESKGEDKFRRGLYTFWRRTDPYPSMVAFDAPSREVCTVSRVRTNTPIQALVTMNDPVFVEAAQGLARRAVTEAGPSTRARAAFAFRAALCREPTQEEVEVLMGLYRSELAHYREAPEAAMVMATQPIGPLPEGANASVLAAWTVVANALMNTDEFLTKR
ncbi:MAG: hypothetical protein RLZZ303_3461 [Candidatus Hydrogenedentota bacterium]